MDHRNWRAALRVGMLPAGIAIALAPGLASAQDGDKDATNLDRIEVTGSRIRGADMETQQPVITLSRQDIEKQGFTSVADVLQNLTSAGAPALSRADALASGESVGGYYVDIRNLGATRTLVLINGKRLGATTGGYQDLSQIPMSAIERVEVLKDGASSIYGSDAIAGVVNVITRKRYSGAEANAYLGQYGQGDGGTQQYSFTLGSAGDRGGATLSVEYYKQDPVMARDRWFSSDGSGTPEYSHEGWSPISHNGSWCDPGAVDCTDPKQAVWKTLDKGGDPSDPAEYHRIGLNEYANSNQQMLLMTGIERRSMFANANYDITDNLQFNADILYNHRSTDQQIAGYPYQSQAFDTPLSGDSAFSPTGYDVDFRRRLWEVPRTTRSELETYRFTGGFDGSFNLGTRLWDWDVGALLSRNSLAKTSHGDASLIATRQALGPSFINANGIAQCGSASNPTSLEACRPWNPLLSYEVGGQGSLADAHLQNFLFPYYTDTGLTRTTSYTANVSGGLFDLPGGEAGLALGYEHRKEQGRFVPDAFAQSGESTGLGATTTEGSYSLNEVYAELNLPILADVAGAKELTFNLASRYSDYSNFGDTVNSKFGFSWRPVEDLLIRGTWAQGFRAPTIDNLYGGVGTSFEQYIDPCGVNSPTGTVNGNAACNAAGVPLGYVQLAQGYVPCTSYPCATPDQFLSGSNPNLKPETSVSKTIGIVWSPRWFEGLDISLDWYNYNVENMIVSDDVDTILEDCYVFGESSRCANAGVVRAADGHVYTMFYGLANIGRMETSGYDLGVKYRLPALTVGQFSIDWQSSYVSQYDEERRIDGVNRMVGSVGDPGLFRLRSNFGVDWEKGDWSVAYMARYYSGMKEACTGHGCDEPGRYVYDHPAPVRTVGSNTFHDIQVGWKTPWNATVALGANNVFDHEGPALYSNSDERKSDFPGYGGFDIGRFWYLKYQQRF